MKVFSSVNIICFKYVIQGLECVKQVINVICAKFHISLSIIKRVPFPERSTYHFSHLVPIFVLYIEVYVIDKVWCKYSLNINICTPPQPCRNTRDVTWITIGRADGFPGVPTPSSCHILVAAAMANWSCRPWFCISYAFHPLFCAVGMS